MSKLILMSGLQGSGKSTRAKEILVADGNAVRVNRDLLRTMLHHHWTPKNEGQTIVAEIKLAKLFLSTGKNVIVDDTNLSEKTVSRWKNVAKEAGAKFESIPINTPLNTCILQDASRSNPVGWDVITNTAIKFGLYKPSKGFVLCDLDGTLCDITHRLGFVRQEPKDWEGFFCGLVSDSVRINVREMLVDFVTQGYDLVFVSGRPDTYKTQTLAWLNDSNFFPAWVYAPDAFVGECEDGSSVLFRSLMMRRGSDRRPDYIVKQEILRQNFPDKSLIYKVIDDRPSVIEMWKENGLDVIDVGNGVEF